MKRSLLLLILLLTLNFNSFSQTVTDSTQVRLSTPIARLVIKDLISGDQAKQENLVLTGLVRNLNTQAAFQKELNSNLTKQIQNSDLIVLQKTTQLKTSQQINKELQKTLKRTRRRQAMYKAGSISGMVIIAFLVLK